MKLRLNLNNYDLAFRFSVSTVTVGRVFSRWIGAMDVRLSPLVRWPERESVQNLADSVACSMVEDCSQKGHLTSNTPDPQQLQSMNASGDAPNE